MSNRRKRQPQRIKKDIDNEIISMRQERENESLSSLDYKIKLKFKNKKQKDFYDAILENRITFVNAPAGVGKTLITLMAGLELLKDPTQKISKIIITKPIVEASASMGFLPGDLASKFSVYLHSFYTNIEKIIGNDSMRYLKEKNLIREVPLNFMRGNTFGEYDDLGNPIGMFCAADEMQNSTVKEMKLFISRMGEGTKLVILGDIEQTDIKFKNGEKSGLEDAFERFKNIKGIGFVEFTEDDIVRDPFLIEIMKRYKI